MRHKAKYEAKETTHKVGEAIQTFVNEVHGIGVDGTTFTMLRGKGFDERETRFWCGASHF